MKIKTPHIKNFWDTANAYTEGNLQLNTSIKRELGACLKKFGGLKQNKLKLKPEEIRK